MTRLFGGNNKAGVHFVCVVLLSICVGCDLGHAPQAEARLRSSNQMKELILGIKCYRDVNDGQWPNGLSDIKPFLTDTHFNVLMSNPITGDIPGYEYVKPTDEVDLKTTVVLYQLRNGQRATDLHDLQRFSI
jgi:hypothetical protein